MSTAVRATAKFRGILCRFCGKVIALPGSMLDKEKGFVESEVDSLYQLRSRVFPLRCKRCGTEGVYGFNDVADFPET